MMYCLILEKSHSFACADARSRISQRQMGIVRSSAALLRGVDKQTSAGFGSRCDQPNAPALRRISPPGLGRPRTERRSD